MKQDYYKICGFVRGRTSPATVVYSSLLLIVDRDKEVRINQWPEMVYGVVTSLHYTMTRLRGSASGSELRVMEVTYMGDGKTWEAHGI